MLAVELDNVAVMLKTHSISLAQELEQKSQAIRQAISRYGVVDDVFTYEINGKTIGPLLFQKESYAHELRKDMAVTTSWTMPMCRCVSQHTFSLKKLDLTHPLGLSPYSLCHTSGSWVRPSIRSCD